MDAMMEGTEKMIQRLLQEAADHPDLSLNLQDSSTQSGKVHVAPPLRAPPLSSGPNLPVVSAVHTVPLPLEMMDYFDPMQNPQCMMGVFPEISQAWLVIDHHLFLWNFQTGQNVIHFDGLRDNILCAGLVRPKEGLLQPQISYVLVVATPARVVLLGVMVPTLQTGDLHDCTSVDIQLLTEPLYSVAAEDTYICVSGAHNGRVFLSAKSGCLYEVVYRAKAGWLSSKCWMINHSQSTLSKILAPVLFHKHVPIVQVAVDNSRHILYTRSENGVLRVYDLGQDGNGICQVASVSQDKIISSAIDFLKTVDPSVFIPIVQIAVIEKADSVKWHLVAVTHAGFRLYFSTAPLEQPAGRPCRLSLVHVHVPSDFSDSAITEMPSKVHKALYSDGVFLMADPQHGTSDLLWCLNYDPLPFQKSVKELFAVIPVSGHTCALAPIPDYTVQRQQHRIPVKKFVAVSAMGCHIFHLISPVEQLRHLLINTSGLVREESLLQFFNTYDQDQACAASLLLACSTAATDHYLSTLATQAFFTYGGIAQGRTIRSPPAFSTFRAGLNCPIPVVSPVRTCSQVPNSSSLASLERPSCLPEKKFSGGHNGIYIYFTCIIAPFWEKEVITERRVKIESSMSSQDLGSVLQNLRGLLEFLDRNFQFGPESHRDTRAKYGSVIPRGNRATTGTRWKLKNSSGRTSNAQNNDVNIHQGQELHSKCHVEAQITEKSSLQEVHQLLRRTCQTLALWELLCGKDFHQVVSQLDIEMLKQLKKMTFKDLIIRDKKLTRALIASLIHCHIQHNVAVEEIISYLERVCPLFYSAEDVTLCRAHGNLQMSRQVQSQRDKERLLQASLQEYLKICHLVDLADVCAQYRQVQFYEGVVKLCLRLAEKKDPHGFGLHFWKNGKSRGDASGLKASEERMNSYKIIFDLLQELVNQSKSALPREPTNLKLSSQQRCDYHLHQILKVAERSSDECFHISLFNWLLQADLADIMLELESPFLESHLTHLCIHEENLVSSLHLLWRYHQKKGNYISAARVLAKLAASNSTNIPLGTRIEYLSTAILSARAARAKEREFLYEIEEIMDVAKVQLQIQKTLLRDSSHQPSQDAVAQLDSQLMDLTDLYEKFAHPFQLSECKLAIIQCASYSNVRLVQSIWEEIIQRELKNSVEMNAADRMLLLNMKLVSLGKIYASTPLCFPLRHLIKYLEQQVCTLDWPVGFVSKTMLDMNVPFPRLWAEYDHLYRVINPFWTEKKKPFHLLECIHGLLSGFVGDITTVPSHERRQFITTCLKAFSSYLVPFQSMEPTPAVKSFFYSLQHLKISLEQILADGIY